MINPKIKICGISDIEILKQLIKLNLEIIDLIIFCLVILHNNDIVH